MQSHIDWLFYTCNLYLGLILKVNLSLAPTIHSFLVNECLTASLSLGCALHLFNAETHFAWFKQITELCSLVLTQANIGL